MAAPDNIWTYNGIPVVVSSHVPDDTMYVINDGRVVGALTSNSKRIVMSNVVFERLRPHLGAIGDPPPPTLSPARPAEEIVLRSRYDIARDG